MGMASVFVKKGVHALMLISFVVVLNFLLFRVMPGDPVSIMKPPDMIFTAEQKQVLREAYGLDKPLYIQFVSYIKDLASGNMGISFFHHRDVLQLILERMPNTILLLMASETTCIIMGVIFGLIAAWKRGSNVDISSIVISLTLYSMPMFWLGGLFLLYFGVNLDLFPISGIITPWKPHPTMFSYIADVAHHMFLPWLALSIGGFGGLFLIMRNSMLDVFSEDYIVTAKAIGLSNRTILFNNALRNSMLPLITIVMLWYGFMVGGAITTETIFSWPGVGRLIFDAIMGEDYPLLQGAFLFISIFVILSNFIAEILYAYLDPRVRLE